MKEGDKILEIQVLILKLISEEGEKGYWIVDLAKDHPVKSAIHVLTNT